MDQTNLFRDQLISFGRRAIKTRLDSLNLIEIDCPTLHRRGTGERMNNQLASRRPTSLSLIFAVLAICGMLALPIAVVEAAISNATSNTEGSTPSGNTAAVGGIAPVASARTTSTLSDTGGHDRAQVSIACTYSIDPTSKMLPAIAISGIVTVATQAGCTWTATSNAAFITITSGASGSGNGAVHYSVTANKGAARTGTATIAGQTFTVIQDSPVGAKAAFDFNADRLSDLSLWDPTTGQWIGPISGTSVLGQSTDMIVPADYDGDIVTDIAVWTPSSGIWTIIQSDSQETKSVLWGLNGDLPVPADYDGDGKADLAVWRPSTGAWFIINSATGTSRAVSWGVNGDVPVPGDYDDDGKADLAIWRPSTGAWFVINSSNGSVTVTGWGVSGDKAVPADYDGDGKTDIAVWRPSSGAWYIINSSNGSVTVVGWGISSDIAVPADYDGDVKTDIAVWRPSTAQWFIIKSSDGSISVQLLGSSGNIPVPSAFIR